MKKILLLILFIISLSNLVFARAGGGSSSSSSSSHLNSHSSSLSSIFFEILFYTILGLSGFAIIYSRYLRKKNIEKAKIDLETATLADNSWDIKELKKNVEKIFFEYQNARSKKDLLPIKSLFFEDYYIVMNDKMNKDLHLEINVLKDIKILEMNLIEIKDLDGKNNDAFTIEIKASMIDYFINEKTGKILQSEKNCRRGFLIELNKTIPVKFTEYWTFIRQNDNWVLFYTDKYILDLDIIARKLPKEYKEIIVAINTKNEKKVEININNDNSKNNNTQESMKL